MSTGISWTDETWNPTVGCSRVSPGCENCYAEKVAHRAMCPQHKGLTVLGKHGVRWNGKINLVPSALEKPLRWRKPRRIFVDSMSDLFHPGVPFDYVAAVFGVMAACAQHTFQVLTKRPRRMMEFFEWVQKEDAAWACGYQARLHIPGVRIYASEEWPLPNVWLGVSAEDQQRWDERVQILVHKVPSAMRFVSAEPLLGPINLRSTGRIHLDWVIVGGESGPGARPCDSMDIDNIVQQCLNDEIPVFVKQLGARSELPLADSKGGDPQEWPIDLRVQQFPEAVR